MGQNSVATVTQVLVTCGNWHLPEHDLLTYMARLSFSKVSTHNRSQLGQGAYILGHGTYNPKAYVHKGGVWILSYTLHYTRCRIGPGLHLDNTAAQNLYLLTKSDKSYLNTYS
jgi:hypothetical protein